MKLLRTALPLLIALAALPPSTTAAELRIGASDSMQSVLAAQKGTRVTLRLRSGQEITGVLRDATARVVHLGALTGREFFDAAVSVEAIEAVIVRVKE